MDRLVSQLKSKGFNKFNEFDNDVMSGKIYERIKDITGKDRKEVKVNVYSVLFGRNMTKNYWNIVFIICNFYIT